MESAKTIAFPIHSVDRTSLFGRLIPDPLHTLFHLDIIAKMVYNC